MTLARKKTVKNGSACGSGTYAAKWGLGRGSGVAGFVACDEIVRELKDDRSIILRKELMMLSTYFPHIADFDRVSMGEGCLRRID